MNKKVRKIIVGTLLITLMGGQVPFADTITEKKSELESQRSMYNSVQDEKEQMNIKIEKLDSEIETILHKLNENKEKEITIKNEIKEKEIEIEKKEKEIEEEQDVFSERVRGMYIANSGNSFMEILFNSEGIGDLISKMAAVKKVTDYNADIISGMKENREELELAKVDLVEKEDEVKKLLAENEAGLAKLDEQKEAQSQLLAEIEEKENVYSSRMRTLESEIATMESATRPSGSGQGPISGGSYDPSGSGVGYDAVAYAQNFLGVPYVWGGSTPSGFDCSGFTQYVYRHVGVNLSRTTYTQQNDGPRISRSQLQVGDLVFFGEYNSPHHVGIYMGNNQYIHAPRTGDVVKISNMTRSDFIYGVRP